MADSLLTNNPEEVPTYSGGGSEVLQKKPRKPKNKGSTITMSHGRRTMKAYPISEGELWQLFTIGLLSALCFSIATALVSYGLDIYKDLALNPSTLEEVVKHWKPIQHWCFGLAVVLVMIAVVSAIFGGLKIQKIKQETEFDEE
jgi:hypothetical protein